MKYLSHIAILGIVLAIFGCLNYFGNAADCKTLICFIEHLREDCYKATLSIDQSYGTLRFESLGPLAVDILSDKAPQCRTNIKITHINESAIPKDQKKLLDDLYIPASAITLADMECLMTAKEFEQIYDEHNTKTGQKVYSTCVGSLKEVADKVPAIKKFAVGE